MVVCLSQGSRGIVSNKGALIERLHLCSCVLFPRPRSTSQACWTPFLRLFSDRVLATRRINRCVPDRFCLGAGIGSVRCLVSALWLSDCVQHGRWKFVTDSSVGAFSYVELGK